jgi:hypothetical protein
MPSWTGHIPQYVKNQTLLSKADNQTGFIRFHPLSQHEPRYIFHTQSHSLSAPKFLNELLEGIAKWPEVLAEAYRCMRPGAYIELAESDRKSGNNLSIMERF